MAIFVFSTEKLMVIAANIKEKLKNVVFRAENILNNIVELAERRYLRHFRCELTRVTYQNYGIALSSCASKVLMKV